MRRGAPERGQTSRRGYRDRARSESGPSSPRARDDSSGALMHDAHRVAHIDPTTSPRVLIIDDNEANLSLLARLLGTMGVREGAMVSDPRQAAARFVALDPDLVVLDLHMPEIDGFGVLAELSEYIAVGDFRPVLVMTADSQAETKQHALRAGAHDFLVKPVDLTEATLRIRNLLETRRLHVALRKQNTELQQSLDEQRTFEAERSEQRVLVEAVLRERSLSMVYQPIVDLETTHIVGVEALARFHHEPRQGPEWWFA